MGERETWGSRHSGSSSRLFAIPSPPPPLSHSPTLPVYAAILSLIFVLAPQHAVGAEPEPIPSLSPQDVVRIQLEALRADRIDIVFNFASPRNKAHTGPLSRFVGMLKSPTYAAMLNHRSVVYGPFRKESGQAFQTVILIPPGGEGVGYVFVLSKYHSNACDGCWMTDSVTRFEPAKPMRGT